MTDVRPAVVAGRFYPGAPMVLQADVRAYVGGAATPSPEGVILPKAVIVPHAGYMYSGAVAGFAYGRLAAGHDTIRRVVLFGPTHRVPVRGLALPAARAFATPLGTIDVDREAVAAALALPCVCESDAAHAFEHSLEVQLPFLQEVLGEFTIVPFAVGDATPREVADVIRLLWGGAETLIVVSTDLSHYHAYADARAIDRATADAVLALDATLDHDQACGATPLNGLLSFSKQKNLSLKLLASCNSGDTAGGKDRVVGYSSFGLYEGGEVALDQAGTTLLSIARDAIESYLSGKDRQTISAPWLAQAGATFVTLTRDDALRGCIGSLEPTRALGEDVAQNALAAALRDPRFPAMSVDEWPQCRVEVSLLSTPKPLRFADEADLLSQIVAGEDGLILEADGRRATFLPQVWEDIADKKLFLAHLLKKAGLPPETRLTRCRVSRYRVFKWKE